MSYCWNKNGISIRTYRLNLEYYMTKLAVAGTQKSLETYIEEILIQFL